MTSLLAFRRNHNCYLAHCMKWVWHLCFRTSGIPPFHGEPSFHPANLPQSMLKPTTSGFCHPSIHRQTQMARVQYGGDQWQGRKAPWQNSKCQSLRCVLLKSLEKWEILRRDLKQEGRRHTGILESSSKHKRQQGKRMTTSEKARDFQEQRNSGQIRVVKLRSYSIIH